MGALGNALWILGRPLGGVRGRGGKGGERRLLVTIVQWLGAAWRNKATVSANSVRQAP